MELDRTELRDSARRVLQGAGVAPDRDKSWSLAVEMGWVALAAPEELGGLDQKRSALCALYVELGRALAAGPVLPATLAIEAISKARGFESQAGWVERLSCGERIAASLEATELAARPEPGGFALNGVLRAVADADQAAHILVAAEGVVGLLPLGTAGVTLTARRTWDLTRRLFDVRLEAAKLPADLVLARDTAANALARDLTAHLLYALAADSLGAAAAVFERTVDYLQTRRQFSRPLAMFQALKHRCADLKAQLAATEALLWQSADGLGTKDLEPLVQAGGVKSRADRVAHAVAEEAIQLHGGIGLTAEHPCHLFVKRLLLNEFLGGHADEWERLAGQHALHNFARR